MSVIDIVLISVSLLICLSTAITDLKKRIIPNIILYPFFCISFPLNLIYSIIHAQSIFYLRNVIFACGFAIILFALHFFSAGDSKLLITLAAAIPTSLYQNTLDGWFPILTWLIALFSFSFLYLVIESIWFAIRGKERFFCHLSFKKVIFNGLQRWILVTAINESIWLFFPAFYASNTYTIILLDFFIMIIIADLALQLPIFIYIILCAVDLIVGIACGYLNGFHMSEFLLFPLIFVFALFQRYLSAYNYYRMATDSVEKGMILSLQSSLLLQASNIQGLPELSTEDTRSKLTEMEAESIRKWAKTKGGQLEIILVRTLPFGALIAAGTFIFLLERVIYWLWIH